MAVSYSLEQKSLQSGLDATFSGEKPCGLCTIVSNGKEHENDSPATVLNVKKLEATLSQRLIPAKRQYDAELRYSLQAERMPRSVALDLPAPVPIVQALA